MVQFAETEYAPLLFLRPSELAAVRNLSATQKSRFLPTFRVQPWLASKAPEASLEKICDAMGDSAFACDLNDWWRPKEKRRPATDAFEAFQSDPVRNGWYEMVRKFDQAIPVIRLDIPQADILALINADWIVERGFCFILNERNEHHFDKLLAALPQIRHSNFFAILDAGWHTDLLQLAAATTARALRLFQINPGLTLFVSSSSFPSSFENIGLGNPISLLEYGLYNEVSRQVSLRTNQSRVRYSDWATTRPPNDMIATGWVPRIDLPEQTAILSFRRRSDEDTKESRAEACVDIAKTIRDVTDWPAPPPSWGHYTIDLTASGSEFGIKSPAKNTAVRINIHLHNVISRIGGADAPGAGTEEPFVD